MVWNVLFPFDIIAGGWREIPDEFFMIGRLYEALTTDGTAPDDEPDVELPLPQCRAIQGLHKVWHIPNIQLITIKVMTHNSMAIRNVSTMAIPVASIFRFTALVTIS